MGNYKRGRRREYRTVQILEKQGYLATRSAGSHGLWDVMAVKSVGLEEEDLKKEGQNLPLKGAKPEIRLVQCKLTKQKKYYEDENCKILRRLEVPDNVRKELWVFYDNPNYKRGHYEIIDLCEEKQ